jgi:hypothetical protein
MDQSEYDENVGNFGTNSEKINDNKRELSYETPEQIVATNLSQQVFASNLFESQTQPKQDKSEVEIGRHSAPVDVFGQHLSQTIDKPFEQRLSGHQQEYDVYEYEEDEEDDDSEDSLDRRQTQSRPNIGSDLMFSSSTNQSSTDPFTGTGVRPKEEILYQLSEDSNVLRAQNYGIGSGLRIDSQNDQNSGNVSVYSLNSEDPFQTPEKKVDQNKQLAEEKYEDLMRREEPFETMSTDFGISSKEKSDNLLEFDINSPQLSAISHSIGLIESNRNHSQSSGESEDEIIVTSSGQVSKLPTHTFAERVSLSPNLDETQTVDTQNTDSTFTQHSIKESLKESFKESSLVSDERKTIDQKSNIQHFTINTTKDKDLLKSDYIMANKKEIQESSSDANNSTTGCGGCPFGSSKSSFISSFLPLFLFIVLFKTTNYLRNK